MVQKYFKRYELKYQVSLKEMDDFIKFLDYFMELDPYSKNAFNYEVRSLYFDSPFRQAYYEKTNGEKIRHKLRIRYYPDYIFDEKDVVFIEIKSKYNENVSKSRICVPFDDAIQIMDSNSKIAKFYYKNASVKDKKTLEEIWFLIKRFYLKPVCLICYKRQAFFGKNEKHFRITFDTNLTARSTNFDLHIGGGTKIIVPKNISVMEIKYSNFIPYWATRVVQINNCTQEKISKFASGLKLTRNYSYV